MYRIDHHELHHTKGSKNVTFTTGIGSKEEGYREDGNTILATY